MIDTMDQIVQKLGVGRWQMGVSNVCYNFNKFGLKEWRW